VTGSSIGLMERVGDTAPAREPSLGDVYPECRPVAIHEIVLGEALLEPKKPFESSLFVSQLERHQEVAALGSTELGLFPEGRLELALRVRRLSQTEVQERGRGRYFRAPLVPSRERLDVGRRGIETAGLKRFPCTIERRSLGRR